MSVTELKQYLDRTGVLVLPPAHTRLRPAVVVRDARSMFGRTELLIAPVSGSGEGWHALSSVKLDPVKGAR